MQNTIIEISSNDLRKALPDAVWNTAEDTFLAVWAAAPGMESSEFDYLISGQKISTTGELIGAPVDVLKTGDILMLPRIVYNPNKNQYLVIYCRGEENFNIRGVILDANGNTLVEQFVVTDVPANQFHYTAAFNSKRNQYLITYNDFRDDVSNVYAVIIDDSGAVVKKEFLLCTATGHQINPVVCYNPKDDTWLINWEDFRAHGNSLEALGTLAVMTDIYGALLSADGTILAGDIPMCADANTINADQRFNGIAYNPKKNEFLASWTDTRAQITNVAVVGRIVKADGSMPEEDFALVDAPGAQMVAIPIMSAKRMHTLSPSSATKTMLTNSTSKTLRPTSTSLRSGLTVAEGRRGRSSIFSAGKGITVLCALPTAKKAMRSYWSGKAISRACPIPRKVIS